MSSTSLSSGIRVIALVTMVGALGSLAATGKVGLPETIGEAGTQQAAGGALPTGIKRVVFGHAEDTKTPSGGSSCAIPKPLSDPIEFEPETTAISFVIEVDPHIVRTLDATVEGDIGASDYRSVNCNAYAVCDGRVCQTQYGSTLSRSDGKALKSGYYKLSIKVGDQALSLPFALK